jgi:hypothetical protein
MILEVIDFVLGKSSGESSHRISTIGSDRPVPNVVIDDNVLV